MLLASGRDIVEGKSMRQRVKMDTHSLDIFRAWNITTYSRSHHMPIAVATTKASPAGASARSIWPRYTFRLRTHKYGLVRQLKYALLRTFSTPTVFQGYGFIRWIYAELDCPQRSSFQACSFTHFCPWTMDLTEGDRNSRTWPGHCDTR